MKKLKTNYVPGDPVTSAGQNEVNATINEIYEKVDGNALNVPKNSAQYHMVFKDKSNDPTNPCSTLELAGFTGVYFKEITAEDYNALPNKYTDPLPAKVSDPTKIYYDSDVEEEFATIPYTKGGDKGDDKTVPGSIMQKWGDGKKGTVYVGYGVQIGSKYYQFALYGKPIRIQLEASHDIDLKTDTSLNIDAKCSVIVESGEVLFDGPTKFELGELEDGLISQFKITKKQDKVTKKYNTKGCDKLIVEIYNNAEDKDTGVKLSQTVNIAEQAFLKGTPIKWWYVVANAGKGGDYNADSNPTGEWLEQKQESGLKRGEVALKYGFTVQDPSTGGLVGDTTKVESRIRSYDMGTDTFCYEGTVELGPQEKKAIASCHVFDVIKFITWAKETQFGPWAANAQANVENV